MAAVTPNIDLHSTGDLCAILQAAPSAILAAAAHADIAPALRLNGVSYFRASDLDAIREALKGKQ